LTDFHRFGIIRFSTFLKIDFFYLILVKLLVFYLQGCVLGGFFGLVFPLWISIGAYNLPRGGYKLDFPTDNCTVANVTDSLTSTTLAPVHIMSVDFHLFG